MIKQSVLSIYEKKEIVLHMKDKVLPANLKPINPILKYCILFNWLIKSSMSQ